MKYGVLFGWNLHLLISFPLINLLLCVVNVSLIRTISCSPLSSPGITRGYRYYRAIRLPVNCLIFSLFIGCLSYSLIIGRISRVSQVAVLSLCNMPGSLTPGKPHAPGPSGGWDVVFRFLRDRRPSRCGTFRGSITEIFEISFLQACYLAVYA